MHHNPTTNTGRSQVTTSLPEDASSLASQLSSEMESVSEASGLVLAAQDESSLSATAASSQVNFLFGSDYLVRRVFVCETRFSNLFSHSDSVPLQSPTL